MQTESELLTLTKHHLLAAELMLQSAQLDIRKYYTVPGNHSSTFLIKMMNSVFNKEKELAVLSEQINEYLGNENKSENKSININVKEKKELIK